MTGIRGQGPVGRKAEGGGGNSFIHPLSAFSLRPFSPLATSHWPLAPNPQSLIPSPHAPRPTPHASRLTPHASRPTPHAPRPTLHARRGIGLLEVLIAIFVLMIGLLGLAVLIVVGKLTLLEVERSDRTGACGRAALHEVKVRNLLNYNGWYSGVAPVLPGALLPPFALDPLGLTATPALPNTLGPLGRITLQTLPGSGTPMLLPQADAIFRSRDDLIFVRPEEMNPPSTTAPAGSRPVAVADPATGFPDYVGDTSWFMTLSPAPAEVSVPVANRTSYNVSVVVCYQRNLLLNTAGTAPDGEHTANVITIAGGIGGATITLDTSAPNLAATTDLLNSLAKNQWVLLIGTNSNVTPATTVAQWYRVVNMGNTATPQLDLVGPDWDMTNYNTTNTNVTVTLVAVDGVTGVYTATLPVQQ